MCAALAGGMILSIAGATLGPREDFPELTVFYSLFWAPTLFYLYGLFAIGRVFRSVAHGDLFGPSLARGMRHAGWAIAAGGVFNLLAIRLLHSATVPRPFSSGVMQPFTGLKFDPAYLVLIMVGISLTLLGRFVDSALLERARAARLEAELAEFL